MYKSVYVRCMFQTLTIEQNRNIDKRQMASRCLFVRSAPRLRKNRIAVVFVPHVRDPTEQSAVSNRLIKPMFAAAVLAAALGVSAGNAAGWRHEPWCADFEYDDVTWDCSYRTFEQCYPNVIGGIRGSCNRNPDSPAAQAPTPAAVSKHTKQHTHR